MHQNNITKPSVRVVHGNAKA